MKFIYPLLVIALIACGESPKTEKASDAAGSTAAAENQSTQPQAQVFPIPYYLGTEFSGSWVIEMSMEQNGSFSVIFKNSGEGTQYQGSFQKSPPIVNGKVVVAGNESLFNGVFEGATSGLATTIRIKGEPCKSKSGFESPTACEIKFDNKTFTGCGNFVD